MNTLKNIMIFCLLAGLSVMASAATWTGLGSDSNWSNADNWDTATSPDQYTEATVDGDDAVTYDVGNFERSAATFVGGNTELTMSGKRFLNARNASCTLTIADNAVITQSGDYFIIGTGHPGTVNQTGGTLNASVNRGFFLGDSGSSTGSSYNLTGGTLNAALVAQGDDWWNELLGRNGTVGTLYVNGGTANFSVDTSMDRRIYIKGNSVLQVDSGSASFTGFKWFSVGRDDAGDAKMIVNGGALNITTRDDGALVVGGQNAQGRIEINGGVFTVASPNGLWVGDGTNCVRGVVEQTGGDVIIDGGDVVMGPASTAVGSYYQMDGGTLTARNLYLHANADPSVKFIFNGGVITVDGDQSTLVDESWFEAAAGTVVSYDSVNDVTVISLFPAYDPLPANGAINVPTDTTLSWKTGLSPDPNDSPDQPNPTITKHVLYMSDGSETDPNLYFVAEIPAGDPVSAIGSYGPLSLDMDKAYSWRVDEVAEPNILTGIVWSFSTPHATPVQTGISPSYSLVGPGATAAIISDYTSVASSVITVTWYLDDVAIDSQADSNVSVVFDDMQSTLTIGSMSEAYEGTYYCIVTNAGGDSDPSDSVELAMKKPVAWYAFENDVTDGVDGNDGTLVGDPNYTAGKIGQSLWLNGIDEAVSIPRSIDNSFTIELWVKTTSTGGTGGWWEGIGLVDGEMSGSVNDFGTVVRGSKFGFGVGNPDVTISSTTDINDNEWHYCVATRDRSNGEMKVYVDGELEATAIGSAGAKADSTELRIGGIQTGGNFLAGQIDEVKLYNYPLTDLTVAAQYSAITGQSVCVESQRPNGKYDFNGDCIVDVADFAEFAADWLECGLYPVCQ